MKELTIEQPTNGTVIQELPVTPELASVTFETELAALMEKYQVQLVPYIIKFNNGNELADAKFMPIQK